MAEILTLIRFIVLAFSDWFRWSTALAARLGRRDSRAREDDFGNEDDEEKSASKV